MDSQQAQRQFLIQLAVDAYNQQHAANYAVSEFDIKTIASKNDFVAVEIFTTRFDDFFRLRLHCNLGTVNKVGPYTLQDDTSNLVGQVGDEVHVADAVLGDMFLEAGRNDPRRSAPVFEADVTLTFSLLDEEYGFMLVTEEGVPIINEEGV